MRDFLTICIIERKALLRGLLLSFLLSFPFTFLPTLFAHGLSLQALLNRFSDAVFYAFSFALLVVVAAVIHNYSSLANRKWYFNRPAFKHLDFYGRIDGQGNLVQELETFLLGKLGAYVFRLNILEPEHKKPKLEIVPLIGLSGKSEEIKFLKAKHGFKQGLFFAKSLDLSRIALEDPESLEKILTELSETLSKLGFESLDIEESTLAYG